MCRTLQQTVQSNVSYFLREQSRNLRNSIEDCGCIVRPWSHGRYCSTSLVSLEILEIIESIKKRPLNSWGRRSWVYLARQSQKAHDEAHSALGAFFFDFAWLLWLSAWDAVGCIPGPREAALRDTFNRDFENVAFHWNAAAFHPWSEDYFSARGAALWMEGR